MPWHDALPADEVWVGEMVGVRVMDTEVLVVNLGDDFYVYLDRCPHQGSRLSEGELDGTRLTCWRHLWEFDVASGQGLNPSTSCLVRFPARVEGGRIQVELSDEQTDVPWRTGALEL